MNNEAWRSIFSVTKTYEKLILYNNGDFHLHYRNLSQKKTFLRLLALNFVATVLKIFLLMVLVILNTSAYADQHGNISNNCYGLNDLRKLYLLNFNELI